LISIAILMGLIDGASPAEIEVILPEVPRSDISCAFAVDFGTPSHKRRILRNQAREALRKGKTQQLHEAWMKRLSAAGTKAMRAGRPLPANMK
jgi:hypothetical protein